MEYGRVPGIDKPISRLVHGCIMVTTEDLDYSFGLLDAAYENGYNAFDNANVYGREREKALGLWAKDRGLRDKVVLLTKGAHHNSDRRRVTPFDITADLHDSLARMETDYIDLYVLHRDDPNVPVGPIVEILNEHQRAGLIHAFGGSNWSHERIAEANAYAQEHDLTPFAVTNPQFSLVEQIEEPWEGCISIGGEQGEAARAYYAKNDIPVFSWSSLARGFLSGRYTRASIDALPDDCDELCIRCFKSDANLERLDRAHALAKAKGLTVPKDATAYIFSQPLNLFALVGCENADELRENAEAQALRLTQEESDWLDLTTDEKPGS